MRQPELDAARLTLASLGSRPSKVRTELEARVPGRDGSFRAFFDSLPGLLAAEELRALVLAMREAKRRRRPILWMVGAHVVKCGLSPLLVDLMRGGYLTALATHGAGAIHDAEIALAGKTSEDVDAALADGSFGMARETGETLGAAAARARARRVGLGQALGELLRRRRAPFRGRSIFAEASRRRVPATVHVAIGTDIVHPHDSADGAAIGEASLRDFRVLAAVVARLGDGGVVLNVGSAVILPEVFLKCVSMARNLGHPVRNFTTANLDMVQHYRPRMNVVHRPVLEGGRGIALTGHHEILVPLLCWALRHGRGPRPSP